MDKKERKVSKQMNDALSLWRVIGCCGIFLVHLGQQMQFSGFLRTITDLGQNGIYVFFAISGYLGFATYKKEEKATTYWMKRAIKILPLYYLVILYYFITDTFIHYNVPVDETGLYWFRYIFFLFGLIHSTNSYWTNLGAVWTIAVFVAFYILMPGLYRIVDSFKKSVVLLVGSGILREVILIYGNGNLMAVEYLFFVFFGVTIYFGMKENKRIGTILLMILGTIGFIFLRRMEIAAPCFISLLIVLTLDLKISNEKIRTIIAKVDKYTYAAYLLQMIVLIDILNLVKGGIVFQITFAVICEVAISMIVSRFLEQPIQQFLYKRGLGR